VLREALAEAARWPEDVTIAVNVSPAQMQGDTLARQVIHALSISGVAPHRLELEITETLLIHDSEPHRRLLHELRLIGVRIALDDFGTGCSSLNYLRSFPFDKLKIDRSFVRDLVGSADCRSIVATVLSLARRFRMETIAEGIEDEAQLAVLAELGCDYAQGFLFSEALPASELEFGGTAPDEPQPQWLSLD
jgi:EAL domain-containing protein (putative c-di-GMP-specific phosphodiesterase class I)